MATCLELVRSSDSKTRQTFVRQTLAALFPVPSDSRMMFFDGICWSCACSDCSFDIVSLPPPHRDFLGSLRCCLRCRFWHASRDNNYRMLPSQKMVMSIHTPDPRCLIYTCKVPANSL